MSTHSTRFIAAAFLLLATTAFAQTPAPAPPPPPWGGTLSAGIALTGGNTDTTKINLAFDVLSDKTQRNVVKAEGLNIRASQDGEEIVDRTSLSARDEFTISPRTYIFGQFQYLRDAFKGIDYLLAPTAGAGFKVINTDATTVNVDAAVGGVFEKNPGLDRRSDGAVTLGQKASHKLGTATVTQSLTALWVATDFADSLYTFQAGIGADVWRRVQVKVDFLDSYKSRPPNVLVQRNDTALLTSVAFRF
jgi:putative salt-induced outer membrane protein YdiY